MSLTRRLLKELELDDNTIERIITAHVSTVDALRQERDAALAQSEEQLSQAASAREELAAYRTQVEQAQHAAARRSALSEALLARGANAAALPLLLDAIHLPEEAWHADALADADAALHPYRTQYAGLFAARQPLPITRISPPLNSGGTLTPADVKRMSANDINRNWSAVQKALKDNHR